MKNQVQKNDRGSKIYNHFLNLGIMIMRQKMKTLKNFLQEILYY